MTKPREYSDNSQIGQVRMTSPHPESYLAFACRVAEVVAELDGRARVNPAVLPTSEREIEELWAREACEAVLAARTTIQLRGHEVIARRMIEKHLGALIAANDGAVTLSKDLAAQFARQTREIAKNLPAHKRRVWQLDEEWHPERSTAAEVAVGSLLLNLSSPRAFLDTVDTLNLGLDAKLNAYSMTDDNLRNALGTFMRIEGRPGRSMRLSAGEVIPPLLVEKCISLVAGAIVTKQLWHWLGRRVAPKKIDASHLNRAVDDVEFQSALLIFEAELDVENVTSVAIDGARFILGKALARSVKKRNGAMQANPPLEFHAK